MLGNILLLEQSVRSSGTNDFFLSPKSFNGISREFKRCFKLEGCLWKFQGCFKKILRVFTESFNGVSRKFQGCLTEVSRVFQGSFSEVSRQFLRGFHGYLKEVKAVFQESFKGASRKYRKCFKGI